MEELFPVLILIIATIASAATKVKQKKAAAQKNQENFRKSVTEEYQRKEEKEQPAAKPVFASAAPARPAAANRQAPARMGTEGEDACHAYMLDDPSPIYMEEQVSQEARRQTARELLQGVIMSEVLRRPAGCRGRRV
ncbi:MAG: hypothetical protein E7329_07950 [Clostridiales bacterium]|nr:hypothetical protein [Clostridiales bacterium]